MKGWQLILKQHHTIEILDSERAIIKNVIYDTNDKTIYDDMVTRTEEGYRDSDGNFYNNIYEYLGY